MTSFQNDTMTSHPASSEALEMSARHLDRMMNIDAGSSSLSERLGGGGVSGLHDRDYPAMSGHGPESQVRKVNGIFGNEKVVPQHQFSGKVPNFMYLIFYILHLYLPILLFINPNGAGGGTFWKLQMAKWVLVHFYHWRD